MTSRGIVALPATPAMAACSTVLPTISCGSGAGGYSNGGVVSGDVLITVTPGGEVTTGVNVGNAANTADFTLDVQGKSGSFAAGTIAGGANDGVNLVTQDGTVRVTTAEGTSISGSTTGNKDGIRIRTTTGDQHFDLNGDAHAGLRGEALDLQSSKAGDIELNLHNGTYTGNSNKGVTGSQAIVVGSVGGHVEVQVDNEIVIKAGPSTRSHGIWIINSDDADMEFNGRIEGISKDAVGRDGIHVGYDAGIGAGTAKDVKLYLGDKAHIVATNDGVHIEASGDVEFGNSGHLEGGVSGAHITADGNITGWNNSPNSSIGGAVGIDLSGNSVDFGNGDGVVAGVDFFNGIGFDIHDVTGVGFNGKNSVQLGNNGYWDDNGTPGDLSDDTSHPGGVIVGVSAAVRVDTVKDGGVAIYNGGFTHEEPGDNNGRYSPGGLIAGGFFGVAISNVDHGDVYVGNSNTRETGPLDLGTIDTSVYDLIALTPGFDATDSTLPGGYKEGIWAFGQAVWVDGVTGQVTVDNASGVIVGGLAAVSIADVANGDKLAVDIYNGSSLENAYGGILWSEGSPLDVQHVTGDVNFNNGNGLAFGVHEGVSIDHVIGDVDVGNDVGGVIQSLYGDAIKISHITELAGHGGQVQIYNGGSIFAGDTAIRIDGAKTVDIDNWGAIIGDGDSGQPVIGVDNVTGDGSGDPAVYIHNGGVIASFELPGVTTEWSSPSDTDITKDAGWSVDYGLLASDLGALGDFVWHGGTLGMISDLADYSDAAHARVIGVQTGTQSTHIDNGGLLVGRLVVHGEAGGADNVLVNDRLWLVGGWNKLSGTDDDRIENNGWIQTAFDSKSTEWTSFHVDSFNNNADSVVSTVDGGTGDFTSFHGDFNGNGGQAALDVNLDHDHLDADWLRFGDGTVSGDTGMIVRLVDSGGTHGDRVEVVEYDGSADMSDARFFVSSASDNYIEMSGKGYVEDGLLAWYVEHRPADSEFDLVAGWGPGAINAAGVITAAQSVFDSGMGVVEDHIYGGQFASAGGGGADLGSAAPPMVIGGTRSAVWLKASGDLVARDTRVTVDGTVVNSGSTQDIFSLLGGADFRPDGTDFRAGVFGGVVGTNVDFNLPGTRVDDFVETLAKASKIVVSLTLADGRNVNFDVSIKGLPDALHALKPPAETAPGAQ